MKNLFLAASGSLAVIPGLVTLQSGVGTPPGSKVLFGGGVEAKLEERLSLKLEYRYSHFGGASASIKDEDYDVIIKIDDRPYLAHRVAWAMVHETWPDCIVHRNGRLSDNRLRNLRDMSRKAVQRRPVIYRTNTSGVRGVSWNRVIRKWVASIRVSGWAGAKLPPLRHSRAAVASRSVSPDTIATTPPAWKFP